MTASARLPVTAAAVLLLAALTALAGTRAHAQRRVDRVTLELRRATFPEALEKIFLSVGRQYRLETRGVQREPFSGRFVDVPLERALRRLLEGTRPPLTFRVDESGRYVISAAAPSPQPKLSAPAPAVPPSKESPERPELVVQTGHFEGILELCFSPDGKRLASVSQDEMVVVWDVPAARGIQTLRGRMSRHAFTPDGRRLVTGEGHVVWTWDVETGRRLGRQYVEGTVHCPALSPDGQRLLVGMVDFLEMRELESGRRLWRVETPGLGYDVSFSPDGSRVAAWVGWSLAAVPADRNVLLLDARTGRLLNTIQCRETVKNCAFSPDGRYLATAGEPYALRLWDGPTGRAVREIDPGSSGERPWRVGMTFTPDSRQLLTSAGWNRLRAWDPRTSARAELPAEGTSWVRALACSRDGRLFAAGSSDGSIRTWDAELRTVNREFKADASGVSLVAFTHYRRSPVLLTAGRNGIRLWHLGMLRPPVRLPGTEPFALSQDRKYLFARNGQRAVNAWDLATGEVVATCSTVDGVRALAVSRSGALLAGALPGGQVQVWQALNGEPLATLEGHPKEDASVAFGADDAHVVTWSRSSIKFWNLRGGGGVPATFEVERIPVLSPDGTLAGFSAKGQLFIAETATGRLIRTLPEPRMGQLAFSPDNRYVAAADWDVSIFELERGIRLPDLRAAGYRAQFSPDGETLLTFGEFSGRTAPGAERKVTWEKLSMVRLTDWRRGTRLATLSGHLGNITNVARSGDGRLLATAGSDGTARLWDLERGEERARFLAVGEDQYVVTTPDNDYMASKSALRYIGFRYRDQVFPFEQFDVKFNRPDRVLRRLGLAPPELVSTYHRLYQKRLKRLNFQEEMLSGDLHLPEVRLLGDLPLSTTEKKVGLRVEASDPRFPLDRLNVYVNDVPVYGSRGLPLEAANAVERAVEVELTPGRNKVQVSVHNQRGVESLRTTGYVQYNGPAPRSNLYVAVVGVSRYRHSAWETLNWAAKDARDLVSLFAPAVPAQAPASRTTGRVPAPKKPTRRSARRPPVRRPAARPARASAPPASPAARIYGQVLSRVLVDGEATRENILGLRRWLEQSRPEDHVILFLAGHGKLDDASLEYHFATAETDPHRLAATSLAYEEIVGLLDGIPARRKLLLLDSCYSGEVETEDVPVLAAAEPAEPAAPASAARGVKAGKPRGQGVDQRRTVKVRGPRSLTEEKVGLNRYFELISEEFADLRRGSGAVVISAATGNQPAGEGVTDDGAELRNGWFTYALLEGLARRQADRNGDRQVTVSELYRYVLRRVMVISGGRQRPTSREENLEEDFRIY